MGKNSQPEIEANPQAWEDLIESIDSQKPFLKVGETVTVLPSAPETIDVENVGKDGSKWKSQNYVFAILQKDGSVAYRTTYGRIAREIAGKLRMENYPLEGIRYTRNQ